MAKISVYLNPHASQAVHQFNVDELKKYFFRYEVEIKNPSSLDELVKMIKVDRDTGVECIFSVGGDGTAHTIAQNLVGSKTKLLVLPGGTANDFANELGTNSNLKKVAGIFHARNTKLVDIIKVNDRFLMTNGGIGIASKVASKVNKLRKQLSLFKSLLKTAGKNTYSLMFIQELITCPFEMRDVFINSPDLPLLEKKISSPLILINNQSKLAGKFPVAPATKNDDGKFNVTIFLHDNKMDFMKASSAFLLGKFPENDKKIIQFETSQLQMISLDHKDLDFFGDGESFEASRELNISIVPKALEVFAHNDNLLLCSSYSLDSIPAIQ
jgi:diacylglycerol kinase family enzyme